MKAKWIVLLMVLVGLATGTFAGQIDWGSYDLGAGYTDGWIVALYEDVNKDGWSATSISSTGITDSDDTYLSMTTLLAIGKAGSAWGTNFYAPAGSLAFSDRVYSVLFNAPTIAAASQYKVTTMTTQGNSWFELPSSDIDNTYVTTSMSTWQAVPEPATALLFAMGGFGAWLIRRNKMKA